MRSQPPAGSFDVGYLGQLPGFVLMASADETELQRMVATAHMIDDRPSAFRYPPAMNPSGPPRMPPISAPGHDQVSFFSSGQDLIRSYFDLGRGRLV